MRGLRILLMATAFFVHCSGMTAAARSVENSEGGNEICMQQSFLEGLVVSPDIVEVKIVGFENREFLLEVIDTYKGEIRSGNTVRINSERLVGSLPHDVSVIDIFNGAWDGPKSISKEGANFDFSELVIVGDFNPNNSFRGMLYPVVIHDDVVYWMEFGANCSTGSDGYKKLAFISSKHDLEGVIKKSNEYVNLEYTNRIKGKNAIDHFKRFFRPLTRIDTAIHYLDLYDLFMMKMSGQYKDFSFREKMNFIYTAEKEFEYYGFANTFTFHPYILGYSVFLDKMERKDVRKAIVYLQNMDERNTTFLILFSLLDHYLENATLVPCQKQLKHLGHSLEKEFLRDRIWSYLQ